MDKKCDQFRRIFLGCLVTAIIYILMVKNIEINRLSQILRGVDLQIFIFAVLLSFLKNIVISSYKLKIILKMLGLFLNMKEALFIKLGSDTLETVFPFKIGGLPKIVYLNKVFGFPLKKGIASIVMGLGSNLIGLSFIFAIGILLYPLHFTAQNSTFVTITALFLFMFFVFVFCKNKTIREGRNNVNKTYRNQVKNVMYDFLSNFKKIGSINTFFILGISFLQMFGELIIFFLLSRSLGLLLPFKTVLFFFPIIGIIARFPIAFFGLGPREVAVIIFFSNFADKTALLSLGMMYSFVEYIFPATVGLIFLPFFTRKISDGFFNNKNFNIELLSEKK